MMKLTLMAILVGLVSIFSVSNAIAEVSTELNSTDVLIRDVVNVDPPYDAYLKDVLDLPLFRLKPGQDLEFSMEDLAEMIVNRAPALKGRLKTLNLAPQRFTREEFSEDVQSQCVKLVVPIQARDAIRKSHTANSVDCQDDASDDVYYDSQSKNWVAVTDLDIGTRLPVRSPSIFPIMGVGEGLTLQSRVGPTIITRPVKLMVPLFESGWTHVRTSDGTVIRAYFSNEESSTP